MNKQRMIASLAGTAPTPRWLVDEQTVGDIMQSVRNKHRRTAGDYDKIYQEFEGGSIREVCKRLWNFCRDNFKYEVESGEKQLVSCPYTILTRGIVDCKNYSLFIGGVLAGMQRAGKRINWCYRFASYKMFDLDYQHVFVVVMDRGSSIWIDPVLSDFDEKKSYWHKRDIRPANHSVGACVGRMPASVGDAASDLYTWLKNYEQNLQTGVLSATSQKGAIITPIVDAVLVAADIVVPGIAALVPAVGPVVNSLEGRNYNKDQYTGASDYYFYVQGQDLGDSTNVKDAQVPPALQWYETKLGVYVSGRAHVNALRQSPEAYLALYAVNPYTTQDRIRVQLASQVVQQQMPNNLVKGGWANVVGVYDNAVTAAIVNARRVDPTAQVDLTGSVQVAPVSSSIPQWLLLGGAVGLIIFGLSK